LQELRLRVGYTLRIIDVSLQVPTVKDALSRAIIYCGMRMPGVIGGGKDTAF